MSVVEVESLVERADGLQEGVWCQVEKGFWVGNGNGRFLGTVEFSAQGTYLSRDDTNDLVGEFSSVAAAIEAVNDASQKTGR